MRSLRKAGEALDVDAISVDPADKNRPFAAKLAADGAGGAEGKGKLGFPLLSDPDHHVIDLYGLHDPDYDGQRVDGIPRPAVYVVDKSGKVAWAKVESDFRVRPTNEEIRAALDALK